MNKDLKEISFWSLLAWFFLSFCVGNWGITASPNPPTFGTSGLEVKPLTTATTSETIDLSLASDTPTIAYNEKSHQMTPRKSIRLRSGRELVALETTDSTLLWQVLLLTTFWQDHTRIDPDRITPYALYLYCMHHLHRMYFQIPSVFECISVVDSLHPVERIPEIRLQVLYYVLHGPKEPFFNVLPFIENMLQITAWSYPHQVAALLYFAALTSASHDYFPVIWNYFCNAQGDLVNQHDDKEKLFATLPPCCQRSLLLLNRPANMIVRHLGLPLEIYTSPYWERAYKSFSILNNLLASPVSELTMDQLFTFLNRGANIHCITILTRLNWDAPSNKPHRGTFMQQLVDYGLDVNFYLHESVILSLAIKPKAKESLEVLLANGLNPDRLTNEEQESLLNLCLGNKMNTLAALLLDYGANPNIPTRTNKFARIPYTTTGMTALMIAAESPKLVSMLLDKDADVNAQDSEGSTAVFYARSVEVMRILIEHGADPLHKSHRGNRSLLISSLYDVDKVKYLLSLNVIPVNEVIGVNQLSALHCAMALCACEESVRVLLEGGADLNLISHGPLKMTPLMMMDSRLVLDPEWLLEAGVNPDVRDPDGNTALHMAVKEGQGQVVLFLIKIEADINAQNHMGYTPLMYAIKSANLGLASVLILNGARTDLRNQRRQTCVDLARAIRNPNDKKAVMSLLTVGKALKSGK